MLGLGLGSVLGLGLGLGLWLRLGLGLGRASQQLREHRPEGRDALLAGCARVRTRRPQAVERQAQLVPERHDGPVSGRVGRSGARALRQRSARPVLVGRVTGERQAFGRDGARRAGEERRATRGRVLARAEPPQPVQAHPSQLQVPAAQRLLGSIAVAVRRQQAPDRPLG